MSRWVPALAYLAACHLGGDKDRDSDGSGVEDSPDWDSDPTVPATPEPTTTFVGVDLFYEVAIVGDIAGEGELGVALSGLYPSENQLCVALATAPSAGAVDVSADLTFLLTYVDDSYHGVTSLSADADLTGDGLPDLVINYTPLFSVAIFAGPIVPGIELGEADATATIVPGNEELVGQAGDVDGDGIDDLVVVVAGVDYGLYGFVGPFEGARDAADADLTMTYRNNHDAPGHLLSHADLNNDGYADLVYGDSVWGGDDDHGPMRGDPLDDFGAAFLFFGPNMGNASFEDYDALLYGGPRTNDERYGNETAAAMAAPGDMDGDGQPDLAIGAPSYIHEDSLTGAVYLAHGPFSGAMALDDDPTRWIGPNTNRGGPGDYAGGALSAAGDSDGDGLAELWVGVTSSASEYAAWRIHDKGPGDHSLAHADVWIHDAYAPVGVIIDGGKDATGDGRPDFLTSAGSEVYLYSNP